MQPSLGMPDRQPLRDVSLICVDTRHPDQAWWAIQQCQASLTFAATGFFCPSDWAPPPTADGGAQDAVLHPIEPIRSIEDYNRFMLTGLADHVQTSHALVVQWDGFVSEPSRWSADFLQWDYIGAPWYHRGSAGTVGNGGFSLRSRRLLLALRAINHPDAREPEDMAICVTLRPRLEAEFGIRFAPLDVARRFACEYGPFRAAFGFHGMHNFAHVMNRETLEQWLNNCPPDILNTQHARKLIKALMQNGKSSQAIGLLRRRIRQQGMTSDNLVLMIRSITRRIQEALM